MTRAPSPTCRPRGPRPEPAPPSPAEASAEATTATPAASADVPPAIRELAAHLSPALAAEVERWDRVRQARFLYLVRRYVSRGESRPGAARWSAIRILDAHEPGTAREAPGHRPGRLEAARGRLAAGDARRIRHADLLPLQPGGQSFESRLDPTGHRCPSS